MSNLQEFIHAFGGLISKAILIVAAIALLMFFWGIFKYTFAAGSEDARVKAKNTMLWGLISLFVMVSVWGIIYFFQREFALDISQPGGIPTPYGLNDGNRDPNFPGYNPPCGGAFDPCF